MNRFLETIVLHRKKLIPLILISAVLMFPIMIEYKDSDQYRFDLEKFICNGSYVENGVIVADADISDGSEVANSDAFWLTKGAYTIDILYKTSVNSHIDLTIDNDQFRQYDLDPANDSISISFVVSDPTNRAKIQVYSDSGSDLVIRDITMYADHRIYTDSVYHAVLLFIAVLLIAFFAIRSKPIKSFDDIPDAFYVIIAIISATFMFYLVDGGGQIFCIDTRAHMLRIEGIAEGLRDGQFPVVIAPNYFNKFGQLEFVYPNLFLYPFALLRLFGVSMTETYRSFMLFINILTGICTYYAGRSIFTRREVYLSVVFLYLLAPHRMDVMLDLGAAGGTGLAVAFLPLCISGFYFLLKNDKVCIRQLVIGMSGILNSHIVTLILATGFLLFMTVINVRRLIADKCKCFLMLCKAAGITLLLNLGFLVIFLGCYMSEWDKKRIQWSDYMSMAQDLKSVPRSPLIWLYVLAVVFATAVLIIMVKELSNDNRNYMTQLLIVAVLSIIASSNLIPWDTLFEKSGIVKDIFMYIQLPHRFFTIFEPVMIILAGMIASQLFEISRTNKITHAKMAAVVSSGVLVILFIISTYGMVRKYYRSDNLLLDQVRGNINTFYQLDYVPSEFDEESYVSDSAYIIGNEEDLEVLSYYKQGTHINLEYDNKSGDEAVYVVFPLTYYEGYDVRDEEGLPQEVFKSDNGRIMVRLEDGGTHQLSLRYQVKSVYTLLYVIMLAGWTVYIIYVVKKNRPL